MEPEPAFIMGMVLGWLVTLFVQAFARRKVRHALKTVPNVDANRTVALLVQDNDRQAAQIDRLQERLAVIERITTDPTERTARAIEALRDH